MKIGIITLPLHTNYGGILQAYALQTILERMGHQVQVIDRPLRKRISMLTYVKYAKRIFCKYLLGRDVIIMAEKKYNREQEIRETYIRPFINKYIHYRNIVSFIEISPTDYDAIIVGSDQVWRPMCFVSMYNTKMENAFLEFTHEWNIKRISYAASFGTDEWEYNQEQTDNCRKLVQMFDKISVREKSAISLCRQQWNVETKWVLDPTMLLKDDDYLNLIGEDSTQKGNLMCYVLDESPKIEELISMISKKYQLTPFRANKSFSYQSSMEENICPPLESWIKGFRDSNLIITDSFHACVFSILFRKPFIVVGNRMRGYSRFESLLENFSLKDRLIEQADQFNPNMLLPLPETVYNKLNTYRKESMEFLKESLG